MPAKAKSAAALAKEAADAAAAGAASGHSSSFEDAIDEDPAGILKDLLAYMNILT